MPRSLPLRANLEWLRKLSKEHLDALRAENPEATLAEAQLEIARNYGFASWRRLKAHVEQARAKLDELVPPRLVREGSAEEIAPDDPELARLLAAAVAGEVQNVAELLARRPCSPAPADRVAGRPCTLPPNSMTRSSLRCSSPLVPAPRRSTANPATPSSRGPSPATPANVPRPCYAWGPSWT